MNGAARQSSVESERGIALILVLMVLPLVAIIMTQVDFEVTVGEHLANNALANQQFKYAIRARLEQMRQRLVRDLKTDAENAQQQGGAFDHYGEEWGPESEGGGTSAMVRKGEEGSDDEVVLYTQIWDEAGKFNLNLLRHTDPARRARAFEVLKNLLDFFRDPRFGDFEDSAWDLNEVEARELAEAIRQFLRGEERDERVRMTELPAPTPDLKQGIFSVEDLVFAHRLVGEKRLLERFEDLDSNQTMPGLRDFLTVFGDGRINANTAPIQVLRALWKEEEGQRDVAEEILHKRGGFLETEEDQEAREETQQERKEREEAGEEEEDSQQGYPTVNDLIQNVEGLRNNALLRRNDIDIARDFTVRTNFFTIVVTAQRGNFIRQQRVVVERHTDGVLTWESEVRQADVTDLPEGAETAPEER